MRFQGARMAGAHPIIAVDLLDTKLDAAMEFGATDTVNPANVDTKKEIAQITGGKLADYVFVTVGSLAAAEQAYRYAGKRGMVVFVGIPDWKSTVPVPVGLTILTEKTVVGSFMGSSRIQVDVPHLVTMYENERLKLDELITAQYPLSQINEAIAALESGSVLRNIITFS